MYIEFENLPTFEERPDWLILDESILNEVKELIIRNIYIDCDYNENTFYVKGDISLEDLFNTVAALLKLDTCNEITILTFIKFCMTDLEKVCIFIHRKYHIVSTPDFILNESLSTLLKLPAKFKNNFFRTPNTTVASVLKKRL